MAFLPVHLSYAWVAFLHPSKTHKNAVRAVYGQNALPVLGRERRSEKKVELLHNHWWAVMIFDRLVILVRQQILPKIVFGKYSSNKFTWFAFQPLSRQRPNMLLSDHPISVFRRTPFKSTSRRILSTDQRAVWGKRHSPDGQVELTKFTIRASQINFSKRIFLGSRLLKF